MAPLVAVKTERPVDKGMQSEILQKLHKVEVDKNVKANDVVCVLEIDEKKIPIIATANAR